MAGFVQLVEVTTRRFDELRAFLESYREQHPEMGPSRITVTADRNRPDTYVSIVEFDSYEAAMRNSEDPVTQEFSEAIAAFCDGPPEFRDLDVEMQEIRLPAARSAAEHLTDA